MKMPRPTLLLVEDDPSLQAALALRLEQADYELKAATCGREALEIYGEHAVDVALLDYHLPDMTGLDVLAAFGRVDPDHVTIMLTGNRDVRTVVEAMRAGAWNYMAKPFESHELLTQLERAAETSRLRRENRRLRYDSDRAVLRLPQMVGNSRLMAKVAETIERVNRAGRSTVLVLGESGTGKSLLARRVHAGSARVDKPFMTICCADFSENLLESELFGHERGAFTGATSAKAGLLETAAGGSVFLDEIGEMPLRLQAKLLRFLDDRTIRRIGSTSDRELDVRVIAATNRDLRAMAEDGTFRSDLYYRLAVVPIEIPPLRARPEDIPALVRMFLVKLSHELGVEVPEVSESAMDALRGHSWPGNVRELRNVIERSLILGAGSSIEAADLPAEVRGRERPAAVTDAAFDLEAHIDGIMVDALERFDGNQSAAARWLGISRDRLRYRVEKKDLSTHGAKRSSSPRLSAAPPTAGNPAPSGS